MNVLNAKIVRFKMLPFASLSQYSGARFPNSALHRYVILPEITRCSLYFDKEGRSYVLSAYFVILECHLQMTLLESKEIN